TGRAARRVRRTRFRAGTGRPGGVDRGRWIGRPGVGRVSGPIRPAPAPAQPKPIGLRRALRWVSTGLLAYGAIGMVLVVLGLIATIWVGGRLGSLSDRL